jgi:hypothetical protein
MSTRVLVAALLVQLVIGVAFVIVVVDVLR